MGLADGDEWNMGDRRDRGQGAREKRGRERDLFEGGKREQKLKENTLVFCL